jgi:pyruvate/2-oxoacid:ferredoxin oxidoreductase alpha subunit
MPSDLDDALFFHMCPSIQSGELFGHARMKGHRGLIVFEKALSYGYQGTLASDIKSALYSRTWDQPHRPFVINYILGLGGREIATPDLYKALKESCTPDGPKGDETRWIGLKFFE